jgi:hypothetical protein
MLGVLVYDLRCSKERDPRRAAPLRPVWRRASVSAAAVVALLGAEAAHAEDSDAAKQIATVSVPAGSLNQGLAALGRQTNRFGLAAIAARPRRSARRFRRISSLITIRATGTTSAGGPASLTVHGLSTQAAERGAEVKVAVIGLAHGCPLNPRASDGSRTPRE